jgi:hypothetical protein
MKVGRPADPQPGTVRKHISRELGRILFERARLAEEERDRWRRLYGDLQYVIIDLSEERDEAQAELLAAQADTRKLIIDLASAVRATKLYKEGNT